MQQQKKGTRVCPALWGSRQREANVLLVFVPVVFTRLLSTSPTRLLRLFLQTNVWVVDEVYGLLHKLVSDALPVCGTINFGS